MRLRLTMALLCAMTPAFALAACGSDNAPANSDGSRGDESPDLGVESGVDGDILATEATAEQAAAVCDAFENALSGQAEIESDCTREAVLETDNRTDCEAFRSQCIASERDMTSDDGCNGEEVRAGLATCAAGVRVGDIEACLNEFFGLGGAVSCADAGKVEVPACFVQLLSDCPNLFDDGDGGGMEGPNGAEGPAAGPDQCEPDSGAGSADCPSFCSALLEASCSDGPADMDECMFVCEGVEDMCPGTAATLDACRTRTGSTWTCDGNAPDLPGCGQELLCLGDCVDAVVGQ